MHTQPQACRPRRQVELPSECSGAGNDLVKLATIISLFTFATARPGPSNRERAPSTRRNSERLRLDTTHVLVVTPSSKIKRKTWHRHSGDYTEVQECSVERLLAPKRLLTAGFCRSLIMPAMWVSDPVKRTIITKAAQDACTIATRIVKLSGTSQRQTHESFQISPSCRILP